MIIHFRVQYYVENGRLIRWGLHGRLGLHPGVLSTPQKLGLLAGGWVGAQWFLTALGGDTAPSQR